MDPSMRAEGFTEIIIGDLLPKVQEELRGMADRRSHACEVRGVVGGWVRSW
jgi:hypothetical protein